MNDLPANVQLRETKDVHLDDVLPLYVANDWSSARKPQQLIDGLRNSHTLLTAWRDERMIGLCNALSDGHLVVYYPHAVVMPEFQRLGVGSAMMNRMMEIYQGFHQHVLVADGDAVAFYEKCGFVRAGRTEPMWIYDGADH
ncbi:MAG: GNAT family N-acetyltransferase [Pirellulaceae bacterium]|nr:GNAT family N-acetyltransferase [Pirellulaceae bacterium]